MSSRETHRILWAKLFDIVWSPEVSEWAVRNEKTKEMEVRNSGSNRKCGIECRCSPGCGHGARMERFSAVAFETSCLNHLNHVSRCFCYFFGAFHVERTRRPSFHLCWDPYGWEANSGRSYTLSKKPSWRMFTPCMSFVLAVCIRNFG
jgi:hypothetical protein